jgi:hypothetical protein
MVDTEYGSMLPLMLREHEDDKARRKKDEEALQERLGGCTMFVYWVTDKILQETSTLTRIRGDS